MTTRLSPAAVAGLERLDAANRGLVSSAIVTSEGAIRSFYPAVF